MQHDLERFYNENPEELRLKADGAQHLEFETAMRLMLRFLPDKADVLDSCAGTGRYAFELAKLGCRVTAGDIVQRNVELMLAEQKKTPRLAEIYKGDALDLSRFGDESFDAVLLMGALYHLQREDDRLAAVKEALRVLRSGGLLIISYMNRYGVILCDSEGSLDNLDDIIRFAKDGREGVFYAATPEEMSALISRCGFQILSHAALDGMSGFMHRSAGLLNEQGFRRWEKYHTLTCEVQSLLGTSYHNIIISEKH